MNKMTTFSTIDTKAIFYSTLRISVIVQIITGIIEIITVFLLHPYNRIVTLASLML